MVDWAYGNLKVIKRAQETNRVKNMNDIWELRKDEVLIGTLEVYDQDMFWATARFTPTAVFEPYKTTFSEGRDIPDGGAEQVEWGKWADKIGSFGLHLIHIRTQVRASQFILYINDDQASFRVIFDNHNSKKD